METEHNSGTEEANPTLVQNPSWSKMEDDTKRIYRQKCIKTKSSLHIAKNIARKSEKWKIAWFTMGKILKFQ